MLNIILLRARSHQTLLPPFAEPPPLHSLFGKAVPPYESEDEKRIVLRKFLQLTETNLHVCHTKGGLEELIKDLIQFSEDDDALEVVADGLKKDMGCDWTTVAYLVKRLLQIKRNDAALEQLGLCEDDPSPVCLQKQPRARSISSGVEPTRVSQREMVNRISCLHKLAVALDIT